MCNGIHVMPKGDGWVVTRGNYMLDEFKSHKQALQLAMQRARTSSAILHLHGQDGSVELVDDLLNDDGDQKRRRSLGGRTA